jgi:ABC-type long-subunit fatty acid transport system fused permease/ATPase subunit
MNRILNKLINYLLEKPKTLFLADSLGALLTAFTLFVVLRQFNEYVGMPEDVLTYLSFLALCFCIYSSACFLFLKKRWAPYIRFIGVANLLYCLLTTGLLITYYSLLTITGTIYFLMEMVIICGIGYVELTVAKEIEK